MIEWLNELDTQLLLAVNGAHAPFWDSFMFMFSGKWIWVPMYAAMLYVIALNFSWRQALTLTLCIGLTILFSDQICATVIRPLAERLRPANLLNPISGAVHIVNGYRGGMFGFPSCHAANSFALAAFIAVAIANRKLSLAVFAWATLNSYSRAYLGVHYPGDLLVGAAIGSLIGLGMARVALYALSLLSARERRPLPAACRRTGAVTAVCAITAAAIAAAAALNVTATLHS